MQDRLAKIITRQLGPADPVPAKTRLLKLSLTSIVSSQQPEGPSITLRHYRSVSIVFRCNDHPFGRAWRLRAAKSDVFLVLKGLYTSGLPVYDVEMVGLFPLRPGKSDQRAVTVYIDHDTAASIPWKSWGRDHEAALWSRLTYAHVDARFA